MSSSSSSSSFSSSSFSSCSSSSTETPFVPSSAGYDIAKSGFNAVNRARGGSWPKSKHQPNILNTQYDMQETTRTGVGLGRGYTGAQDIYTESSSSSYSCSSSNSSFSSSSISFSSSSFSSCSSSSCSSSFSSCSSSSSATSFSSSSSCSSSCSSSLSSSSSSATSFSSSSSSSSITGPGPEDGNGAVFITDVTVQSSGNVGNKVLEDGYTLTSFETDTSLITVSLLAFTGSSHYVPRLFVNQEPVDETTLTLNSQGQWIGTYDIDLNGVPTLYATHEDSIEAYIVDVSIASGPVVNDLTFANGYPTSQTELKEDDTFDITFTTDVLSDQVEIVNFEAGKAEVINLTPGLVHTVSINIADRGNGSIIDQTVKIRTRAESNDFWGAYVVASDFHLGDGLGTVNLNNDYPVISTITQSNIDYPSTQSALKNSEQATLNHTITCNSGIFSTAYSSGNAQISFANNTTYEPTKVCTRINGDYNVSTNNVQITSVKTTNQATTTRNALVYIANVASVINLSEASRLRSSVAGSNYTVTLSSTQQIFTPTLADLNANEGTWSGTFTGGTTTWYRTMNVQDSDNKGTYTYTTLSATNLAGIETVTINSGSTYTLGGFTRRTITIAAWPNREASIGTNVADTTKLRCTNLSKGASGSLNFTFSANVADVVDEYTVTDPSGVYNATGSTWYNKDLSNAVSNSTGTMQIEIEEIV